MESELRKIIIDTANKKIQLHGSKNMVKTIDGDQEEFENMLKFIEGCEKEGLLDSCFISYSCII